MTDGAVTGGCHCGTVRFEVRLTDGLATARRCTCSLCRRRGAVAVSAPVGGIRIVAGADSLTSYRFNTGVAEHFFCARCGIYTHHQRRSISDEYGVNAACLDGVSPFDFPAVPVNDGEHHPSDSGVTRQVGILRFEPTPPLTAHPGLPPRPPLLHRAPCRRSASPRPTMPPASSR